LQEHKTLEGVLAALPTMKKSKSKENIETHQGILELSTSWSSWIPTSLSTLAGTNGSCGTRCKALLSVYQDNGFNRFATELRAEVARKMAKARSSELSLTWAMMTMRRWSLIPGSVSGRGSLAGKV